MMRAPAALVVLMTSTLVPYSSAQAAGYGAPSSNNGGNPGGVGNGSQGVNPNGIPNNNAYGNPVVILNANPINNLGGNSGGIPGGAPAGLPGTSTCASQASPTTVFVTVASAGSLNPSGISQPDGSGPDQTIHQTLHPTTTILVSPVQSLQATQSVVEPFTTITIDVWGIGSNSGDNSSPVVTDIHAPPVYSNSVSSPASQSAVNSDAGVATTQSPWSNPQSTVKAGVSNGPGSGPAATAAPYGDTSGLINGPGSPIQASATVSPPFVVVTDTNVHWIPGSQGPTQVTVLSAHTLTLGPDTMASSPPDGSVPRLTFIGPDGTPTIVEYPDGIPTNGGSSALAITTGVAIPTAGASGLGPIASPAGVATCTTYTILGPNGLPTVVQSTWTAAPVTAAPSGFPSGNPSLPGAGQGLSNGLGSTTCTSFTILGPDGRPTVIESTWLLPTPLNTQSVLAVTSGLPSPTLSGVPGQITAGPILPSGLGPVVPGGPGGPGVTTCATYTVLGPDGRPTVVDSTWVVPFAAPTNAAATANAITGIPGQVSGFPSLVPLPSGVQISVNSITTCATYTVLGLNGLPTVVDSTWVVPLPTATANAITGIPNPVTGLPGAPPQAAASAAGVNGVTTCLTYTALGVNGLPTVVESTFVIPASNVLPTATGLGFPSAIPQRNTNPAQAAPPFTSGSGAVTTCITVGVVGPDGKATPVVQTVVLTPSIGNGLPAQATVGFPPLIPQQDQTALPQGISPAISAQQPATTCITIDVFGPNGVVTPVVQTVALSTANPGTGLSTALALSAVPPLPQSLSGGIPGLSGYGNPASGPQSILPPSAVVSGIIASPGNMPTGTLTSLFTVVNGPGGQSLLPLPSYNDPLGNGSPFPGSAQAPQNGLGSLTSQAAGLLTSAQYGPIPTAANGAHIATVLQTSTWTNIIPEQTTTYTINFPLTTMATVTVPASLPLNKRALRRQQSSSASESGWGNSSSTISSAFSENTSLGASLSSALGSQSAISPSLPPVPTTAPAQSSVTTGASAAPTMCANGGKIGNLTLDFDEIKPGPLFNPAEDLWFSEGFLIAPPSSQASQSYIPSSGGQLVEFVPPSLSPTPSASGPLDTAEIGVGPNAASSCFRFDFHGANLGCAAQGNEQWCEFEISAYSYNEGSTKEQSIAWSETKRVPACPNFPNGSCQLTPVQLDGYTNITSVLIKLRVGLGLRVWWGDDFRIGWTDNSCTAATCRAGALPHRVRRTSIESVAQRGVWHWTPSGLERLDDGYIWESLN